MGVATFILQNYLRTQSIRLQREDWKQNAQLLGDEMFTIMSNIQLLPAEQTATDDNGNPITPPDTIDLPDLTFPPGPNGTDPIVNPTDPPPVDGQDFDPNDTDDPDAGGTGSQLTWVRSTHPGKLTSENSGGFFQCDLYFNGLSQPPDNRTVQITDPDLGDDVESGTWVTVFFIAQYKVNTPVTEGGQQLPSTLEVVSIEHLFNAPGPSAGGKIGVVTTPITGGTAASPGVGEVLTKKLVNDVWVNADTASTVYSTVAGEVAVDKDVQLKRVSGKLFIDVEDCGGEDTGGSGTG